MQVKYNMPKTLKLDGTADSSDSDFLRVADNNIWFYSDIDFEPCLALNVELRKLDKQLSAASSGNVKPIINLRINSFGGSVLAAFAVVDTIRSLNCEVHSIIEGSAASAATLISCMCKHRSIGKFSFMLIHQLSAEAGGKMVEMEDDIKNARQFMEVIKNIYKKYSKINAKKIDDILKSDLWLNADQCLEYGLVDHII